MRRVWRALRRAWDGFTVHMIESPCIAVCKMDEQQKFCTGCHRSLQEIEHWSRFNREEKRHVISAAAERRAAAAQSR